MIPKTTILICLLLAVTAYSQTSKSILMHSESVDASKSKCELFRSAEFKQNSQIIFSIVITAESPTPLAKFNEIGQGTAVLVVPEDAKVDYNNIKVHWSDYETGENFKPYTPPGWIEKKAREMAKEMAGSLFEQIPVVGPIMGMVFSFQPEPQGNLGSKIDANEYDLVTTSWESSIMRIAKRIRVDIPVQLGKSKSYGLFASWMTNEQNESGPIYTKVNTITPGLELKIRKEKVPEGMVFVEGGTFNMGSYDGSSDEKPVHKVTLSSFMIGKYEVTQGLWESVMGNNPSDMKGSKRPVEYVYWYDVIEFCNKLSEKDGLTPAYNINKNKKDPSNNSEYDELKWLVSCDFTVNGYRLPTEAEWEYAARGGNKSKGYKYSGSNDINSVAWYGAGSFSGNRSENEGTSEVGKKQPNELGIYDMSGNVWEGCWDWHGEYNSGSQTNPRGTTSGLNRVSRGGSWIYTAERCRVAYRNNAPDSNSNDFGFRLVRTK